MFVQVSNKTKQKKSGWVTERGWRGCAEKMAEQIQKWQREEEEHWELKGVKKKKKGWWN